MTRKDALISCLILLTFVMNLSGKGEQIFPVFASVFCSEATSPALSAIYVFQGIGFALGGEK